jgi:hypothetical protein
VLLVTAAIFAAAVLSSLAPPSKALASIGKANAHVGPGPVTNEVSRNGYRLDFHVAPNKAAVPNAFAVRVARNGKPVRGADVTTSFTMLDMEMGEQAYHLTETSTRCLPALCPRPRHGRALGAGVRDPAAGEAAVRRPARRQGKRMNRLLLDVRFKLFAALVALGLGAAACLVVVLFAQSVLG